MSEKSKRSQALEVKCLAPLAFFAHSPKLVIRILLRKPAG